MSPRRPLLKCRLHLRCKTLKAAARVRHARRNPYLHADPMLLQRKLDHARRLSTIMRTKQGPRCRRPQPPHHREARSGSSLHLPAPALVWTERLLPRPPDQSRIGQRALLVLTPPMKHHVGVHSIGVRHPNHTRTRYQRLLHNPTLLRSRTTPSNLTHRQASIFHQHIVNPEHAQQQMGTSHAYRLATNDPKSAYVKLHLIRHSAHKVCRCTVTIMQKRHEPRLLYGPYRSPDVKVGDTITCAIRGLVEVRGWHDKGSIGIPLGGTKGTRWSIVVSNDLLRALHVEMSSSICWYWAITNVTVGRWRRALSIDGRKVDGFVDALSRVGSVTGRTDANAARLRSFNSRPWSSEELNLLPGQSTPEIVALTGRTVIAIENARVRYSLAQTKQLLHCRACGYTWHAHHDKAPKRCPKHGCRQPLG